MISASPPASAALDGKLSVLDFSALDTDAVEALARKPRSRVPLKAPCNATLPTPVETPSPGESCAAAGASPPRLATPGRIVDLSPDMSQNPQQTNHLRA